VTSFRNVGSRAVGSSLNGSSLRSRAVLIKIGCARSAHHVGSLDRRFARTRSGWRLGLALSLAATCAYGGANSLPRKDTPRPQTSVLELPFGFSLRPLFGDLERLVPSEAGHWQDWQRRFGIDTRYRAWRGPLALAMRGDVLTVQAHVRYWVQARAALLGSFGLETDCGLEEPPRQALIGLQARLRWGADWTLHPQFRVLPTRFLDRCELTVANIDVTPLVGEAFRARMQQSLRQAMAALGPALQGVRHHAGEWWRRLNRPLSLGEDAWLLLHPRAIALSPVQGAGSEARMKLAVAMRPELSLGALPATPAAPLPPLQPLFSGTSELRFDLGLRLDYAALGRRLSEALRGREFRIAERSFGIETVTLGAQDQELHLRLQLTGEAAGSAELWTRPGYDSETRTLRLETLDYLLRPEDPALYDLSLMFYEQIRQALVDSADSFLQQALEQASEHLRLDLRVLAPEGVQTHLDDLALDRLDIALEADGVILRGSASGHIGLRAQN
jgi:hypothetical protein